MTGRSLAKTRWLRPLSIIVVAALLAFFGRPVEAQEIVDPAKPLIEALTAGDTGQSEEEGLRFTSAIEIAVVLTALSLLPAILVSLTSFTRIVIVLSFVRRSLSVNELPPNPILIGLALFLTTFVMGPVFKGVYDEAYVPYKAGDIDATVASSRAWEEMNTFLLANTRQSEIALFMELSEYVPPEEMGEEASLPFTVVVPAFVLSELKTAFQMGFLLFLPFLVIDLVVASVLISMGMFMLPPIMISTPFKILLFILVDGWHLVCESLVGSFITG